MKKSSQILSKHILFLIFATISIALLSAVPVTAADTPSCSDSDGGVLRFVKGTCTVSGSSVSDACSGSDVSERYCKSDGSECLSKTLSCSNLENEYGGPLPLHAHCSDGACVCDSGYFNLDNDGRNGCESTCDPEQNKQNNQGCCLITGYYHPEKFKDENGRESCKKGYCETPACGDECGSNTGISCCSDNGYCHRYKAPEGICYFGYCEEGGNAVSAHTMEKLLMQLVVL